MVPRVKSDGHKQSQAHERRLEKVLGGKRTAASGAFWSRKGDVRTDEWLVEHKYTGKKTFTLKASELEKVTIEAIMDGRKPLFGVALNDKNYVLLLEDDFIELRGDDAP